MGFEEVAALSNSLAPQNVQESVPAWLSTQLRYDQVFQLSHPPIFKQDADQSSHPGWTSDLTRCKQDVDQSSVASVDDDVSVSDSAHGSYSSEGSTQTSWTSATESSDVFLDEESKEQLPQLSRVNSHPTAEQQEQLLRGIQPNDH